MLIKSIASVKKIFLFVDNTNVTIASRFLRYRIQKFNRKKIQQTIHGALFLLRPPARL